MRTKENPPTPIASPIIFPCPVETCVIFKPVNVKLFVGEVLGKVSPKPSCPYYFKIEVILYYFQRNKLEIKHLSQ